MATSDTGLKQREAQAWAALESVKDPELDVSLVALGLIRGLTLAGDEVHVQLTFTSMGCPWTDVIRGNIREQLQRLPGIRSVVIEDVWDRPWSARDLRRDARRRLEEIGIVTS